MSTKASSLTAEQRLVLQTIYDHFHEHAAWPTFIAIDRPLRRERGIDTAEIVITLPESFIVQPQHGSVRPGADEQLRLRLLGIQACAGGSDDTERFVRLLRWFAQQEMAYDPEPDDEAMPWVTSDNVATYLGLHHNDLAVERLHAMLHIGHWGLGSSGINGDEWFVTLGPDIWRFRDVQTVEDCIRVRKEWESEGRPKLETLRELRAIGAITEPPDSAVVSSASLDQLSPPMNNSYVDQQIIDEIRSKESKSPFNAAKLLSLIEELNDNYERRNSYATHAVLRAILDHIPPILAQRDFKAVANNYPWSQTDKRYLKKLTDFRDQADDALHRQISPQADLLDFDDIPTSVWLNRLLQECATRL